MRPDGVASISFGRVTEKQKAQWHNINFAERDVSDLTKLRIYITRASIFSPRRLTESQAEYSERLASLICQRQKSHLDEFDTAVVVDKWLWGSLMKRKKTDFDDERQRQEA